MKASAFDYELSPGRIAQHPAPERDASRLLVLRRDVAGRGTSASGAARSPIGPAIEHSTFREIDRYLEPGDLLVLNDTKVFPARLLGAKESGGRIEILLVEPQTRVETGTLATPFALEDAADGRDEVWLCLAGFSRPPAAGSGLDFGNGLEAGYIGPGPDEMHRVRFRGSRAEVREALWRVGRTPLPPYIQRNGDEAPEAEDASRYQTVYARKEGAVAAPTAGLHFTDALLARLVRKGVGIAKATLHVGPATFLPVRAEEIEDHPMPSERYEIPPATAEAVSAARDRGGRIVAVGTTVVRALESASDGCGGVLPARGRTDLFIYPGYRFRVVEGLITNFHLPRSTLLMLVAAFAGRERILAAYREAIAEGYRFYSYGDATLVL